MNVDVMNLWEGCSLHQLRGRVEEYVPLEMGCCGFNPQLDHSSRVGSNVRNFSSFRTNSMSVHHISNLCPMFFQLNMTKTWPTVRMELSSSHPETNVPDWIWLPLWFSSLFSFYSRFCLLSITISEWPLWLCVQTIKPALPLLFTPSLNYATSFCTPILLIPIFHTTHLGLFPTCSNFAKASAHFSSKLSVALDCWPFHLSFIWLNLHLYIFLHLFPALTTDFNVIFKFKCQSTRFLSNVMSASLSL